MVTTEIPDIRSHLKPRSLAGHRRSSGFVAEWASLNGLVFVFKILGEALLLIAFMLSMGFCVLFFSAVVSPAKSGAYCYEDTCRPDPMDFLKESLGDALYDDRPSPPHSIESVLAELSAPPLPYSLMGEEK